MPYRKRGPREWSPGMKEGVVEGEGEAFKLKFHKAIKHKKDLRHLFPDFKANAEVGIELGDPMEIYFIERYVRGKYMKSIGELMWFPTLHRGGIITFADWQEGELSADWTDATSELDALERWVWDEMVEEK